MPRPPDHRPEDQADDAELRWRGLVEHLPAVVYSAGFAADAPLLYVSPQVERLLGHPPEAFLADDDLWYRLIHPDDLERVRAEERRTHAAVEPFSCEFRMAAADGTERHVWERDHIVRNADGVPLYTQGVIVDLTLLRRTERAVREERDRAQSYLDVAGTVIVVVDRACAITLLNRCGHELLGAGEGELAGVDWIERAVPEEDRAAVRVAFEGWMDGEDPGDTRIDHVVGRDGSRRTVQWTNTVLIGDDGRPSGVLASGTDITERVRAEAEIAFLAYHDPLTGLPNRALLREHLDLALARAREQGRGVALLYLDLDDFKLVNDSLGHRAGDDLLGRLALRLGSVTREADLLARQGGDEFLLLLSDIEEDPADAARAAAEKLLIVLERAFSLGGTEFQVGASIGISTYPRDAADADALLEHADAAMYQAKAAGPGEIREFSASDAGAGLARLSLSTRLRRAIDRDELVLHWQPLVELAGGAVTGLEALVRWQDPQRGLLLPGAFIPDAEETGLVEGIGEWVCRAVAAQRRAWRALGLDPQVGFNLSPRQLRRQDHLDRLLMALGIGELDMSRVTVEITESAMLREDAGVATRVRHLHDAGLTLALDDFGTAYSSLSRLRELPVRWIKVDRSFLAGVPDDDEVTAVLGAVLGLVAALGLEVIVEGVEERRQLAWLEERGIGVAQGYLLGRPVPAEQLTRRLLASPWCRAGVPAPAA